jgi:glutamine amidotransferase
MIAIIDYGVGNLFSLRSSFQYIGADAVVTGDAAEITRCERIVLPGVGAFRDAAEKLRRAGLDGVVRREALSGKPLLGICLGMQMLFEKSLEYGEHEGLGLIPGSVVPLAPLLPPELKVPHIGWNALDFPKGRPKSRLFRNIREGEYVYFVHSYHAAGCDDAVIATAEYGVPVTAAVERENVFGTQFHPEKSGETGLNILRAFCSV